MKKFGKAFIISFLLIAGKVYAQPGWSVNPGSYDYSMTMTGVINLNYSEERDVNNVVGAFVGGVCRGVAQPVFDSQVNRYVVYLLIYSNASAETIDFQVYDASTGATVVISKTIGFAVNKIEGTSEAPYIWSNPTLSSDANILNYGFTGQSSPTVFDTTSIHVEMPAGTDVTALVATYTTSPYAVVNVNSITQTTAISANNFTNPVIYNVVSADETTQKNYTVYVSVANGIPSDIAISNADILEDAGLNSIVGTLSTTDIDILDTHTYSLVSGTGDADNALFTISGDSLLLNTMPDHETKSTYKIRLRTEDQDGASFEKEFTITVSDQNDENPQWSGDAVTLLENMSLQNIYTVVATDADITPAFTVLTYSISAGNSESKFAIDANTGIVSLINSLDYETTTSYTLSITISDGVNTTTGTLTATITDVNDTNPIITTQSGNTQVDETLAVGSQIYTVIASDIDLNTSLSYSILSGNSEGKFQIGSTNGQITLFRALDFETTKSYTLTVSVNDGINSSSAFISIDVMDQNDEIPVPQNATVFVAEDAVLGTLVHSVVATDTDNRAVLRYDIYSGNELGKFIINRFTGKINLISALDFETQSSYSLEIIVSDGLNDSIGLIDIVVTDINDFAPTVGDATVNVSENKNIGDTIFVVTPIDTDATSNFSFTLLTGNQNGTFSIGASSGVISLVGDLDYETQSQYVLSIQVSDGTNITTSTLLILVQNENDELPILNDTSFSVSEFANINDFVGQLIATDQDATSTITYSLVPNSDVGAFSVDANGKIKVSGYLDYEEKHTYQFEVMVNDGINTNTGMVTVYLTNENETNFKAVNVFTPDNDGTNDYWEIEDAYLYRDCKIIIYNHIGETVFSSTGYDQKWDGTSSKAEPLPVDTYYYVVTCPNCKDCNATGFISIVR